jgi:dienelactone hydrolase
MNPNKLILILVSIALIGNVATGADSLKKSSVQAGAAPPTKPAAPAAQPKYAEREVSFTSAGLKIPGTLCLPPDLNGRKPPLVVMVQGSGPHDRDETIGPNKPFAETAHALAVKGVATLRYDKRTILEKPNGPEIVTLKWEVEDDALAALEFARTLTEGDSQHIFLLGHSLGAALSPYIAEGAPWLRGIVLMAAPARPHYAYVDDQIRVILKSRGKTDVEIAATLEKQHQIIGDIEAGKVPDQQMLQGAPIHYMRELIALAPAGELRKERIPALVLQGGKDVQVFQPDFELLKQALDARKNAGDEAKFFPELNHLFMAVQGESTLAAYQTPGHVAFEVTETIAEWVKARSR